MFSPEGVTGYTFMILVSGRWAIQTSLTDLNTFQNLFQLEWIQINDISLSKKTQVYFTPTL